MSDRIQVNGDRLDEIVATDVTFHFEAMSWHRWWGCIRDKEGRELHFGMTDFDIAWEEGWTVLPKDGGPLLFDCPTRWAARDVLHQCEVEGEHKRHRCECGATMKGSEAREVARRGDDSTSVGNYTAVTPNGPQIGDSA